jgi:pimeloyl-ACP methyl ester carboxylesterase
VGNVQHTLYFVAKEASVRRSEIAAMGQLAGEALAAGGALIQQMHEGVAQRAFTHAPAAAPVRLLHDGISKAVYAGLRGGLRGAAQAGGRFAAARAVDDGRSVSSNPGAAFALAALNGFYGNHLSQRTPELAFTMEIRRHRRPVGLDANSIRAAFPDATSRLAVFVHGLCETEDAWRLVPGDPPRRVRRAYGERLQDELSYTPVYLRYNTGLHVSDNGRALARTLQSLHDAWPVSVAEIVLVGHSMGGLVARSACHYGEREGMSFTDGIRHVFCLGTPHLGADLEKGANVLAWALGRLPETRALAAFLNARSVGIKDLRFGSCVEEDWCDCDADEFLRDRCKEVPFLPDAHYYFVGATISPAPLGRLVGDLLVRIPSASGRGSGRGRRIPFEVDNGHELASVNHFGLLNHPAVYEQLRLWITRTPRRPLAALPAPTQATAMLDA